MDDYPPFQGGMIGITPYEWGSRLEPAAANAPRRPTADRPWGSEPQWLACPAAYVHDWQTGRWWVVGEPTARAGLPHLEERASVRETPGGVWTLGTPSGLSDADRRRYESTVARVVEYIRAGDIFQANLTHRLSASFDGDARELFIELVRQAGPWYGAYIELPSGGLAGRGSRAILSASPELFLEVDPHSRRVVTRPIKGTRAADVPGAAEELSASEKDRAELTMIVDLMRNDIGRVCRLGSVRVTEARAIERHGGDPGVWHGVATVEGVLRDDADVERLLRATFPGGSITGAPKIRAMQIIEELEPVQRGVYTGSIGYISVTGHACFNIAIRTMTLSEPRAEARGSDDAPAHGLFKSAVCDYGVGAGIVADSNPAAEWQETLDKAAPFLSLCRTAPLAAAGSAAK